MICEIVSFCNKFISILSFINDNKEIKENYIYFYDR